MIRLFKRNIVIVKKYINFNWLFLLIIFFIIPAGTGNGLAASTPKTNKGVAAVSGAGEQIASNGTIFNGEVPLYKGAQVIETKSYGANSKAELQVAATPQELVDFYKQVMSAKGWETGMAMVQGNVGVLMLKQSGRQLVIKAQGQGQASKVSMALVGQ